MKRICALIGIALLLTQTMFAQSELKFIRDAAVLNKDSTLTIIPTGIANRLAAGTVVAKGGAAETRIERTDETKIIIKVKNAEESPLDVIKAFKMKVVNNGTRIAGLGAYGIKSKALIPFEYDIYGNNCFILTFNSLEPGEYGIWYAPDILDQQLGEHQMTFFGVDDTEPAD